jgi:hypothetical protein
MKKAQPIVSIEQYVVPPDGGLITRFPSNQVFRKNYSGLATASNVRAAAGRLGNAPGYEAALFAPQPITTPLLIFDAQAQTGDPRHILGTLDSLYAITHAIPVIVSAGDGGILAGLSFTFTDSMAISSFGGEALSVTWVMLSGPGTAAFNDAGNIHATATVTAPGLYEFQVTGTDGITSASSTVQVRFLIVTVSPMVYRFPTTAGGTLDLTATITGAADPMNPLAGGFTFGWSKVSGPAAVTFDDPASLTPVVTVPGTSGVDILEAVLAGGGGTSSAETTITVPSGPPYVALTFTGAGAVMGTTLAIDGGAPFTPNGGQQYVITSSIAVASSGTVTPANAGVMTPSFSIQGFNGASITFNSGNTQFASAHTTIAFGVIIYVGEFEGLIPGPFLAGYQNGGGAPLAINESVNLPAPTVVGSSPLTISSRYSFQFGTASFSWTNSITLSI